MMIKNILKKYKCWFIGGGFILLLYIIFFYNLGAYPLLDSDETRYADIARTMLHSKNFTTLYLDNKIFWDKPPLYFWLLDLSFAIFKRICEFTVRIPSVICALSAVLAVYLSTKKALSKKIAIYSAIVLATSVEFVIFARVSILDMVLAANIAFATLCGLMTYFVKENHKKYYWWGFYIFSALGILSKGIPGMIIPFGTMFFVGIWKKNLKEFFKPQYCLPGILFFLCLALPWHIAMYKAHGWTFIHEYIIKHHFERFVGNAELGRTHTCIYFIPTFIIGFLPWTFSFFLSLKKLFSEHKQDFIKMNFIGFIFTFLFFSIAKTKLVTYILPVYPFAALICGYFWSNKNYNKEINLSIYITNGIFIIFSLLLACAKLYLPGNIYNIIHPVQLPLIIAFLACAIAGIVGALKDKQISAFVSYVLLIAFLSGFMLPKFFGIWYQFGQNDLMEYAKFAKTNNQKLAAFDIWERFSLQYYYNGNVEYFSTRKAYGTQYVETTPFKNSLDKHLTVIKKEDLIHLKGKIKYKTLLHGFKYNLIKETK